MVWSLKIVSDHICTENPADTLSQEKISRYGLKNLKIQDTDTVLLKRHALKWSSEKSPDMSGTVVTSCHLIPRKTLYVGIVWRFKIVKRTQL